MSSFIFHLTANLLSRVGSHSCYFILFIFPVKKNIFLFFTEDFRSVLKVIKSQIHSDNMLRDGVTVILALLSVLSELSSNEHNSL